MADYCVTQLIDGNGKFNGNGLDIFADKVNLASCGVTYTVVSIMGPQSSGKSTLLNHLFHTKFRQMDAEVGSSQTTKGVWMAKCVGIVPCMIAMDLEGNDSSERADQDNTAFEKQIALFALASTDIMMINLWSKDVGREHAANKPLLTIIFQNMMQLFGPGRKKTLLFVIRDIFKTPVEKLKPKLLQNIKKIWDEVPKSEAHRSTQFNDIFRVQVIGLSSYERDEDKFKDEVAQLRQSLSSSMSPGGLAFGDRKDVVPGSAFSLNSQDIWKKIKENKNLDLPSQKVMVSKIRCEEIAIEKFNKLVANKDWIKLIAALKTTGPVKGSGERLGTILETYLSEYDTEAMYFDKAVRDEKRDVLLKKKALDLYTPVYYTMLGHLRRTALENFKTSLEQLLSRGNKFASSVRTCTNSFLLEINQGCEESAMRQANCDTSSVALKYLPDINTHVSSLRQSKLSEFKDNCEREYFKYLVTTVQALLEEGRENTWVSIRKLLKSETEVALSKLSTEIVGFELDEQTIANMGQDLSDYAKNLVVEEARRQAENGELLKNMNHRFTNTFKYNQDGLQREWKRNRDIRTFTCYALETSLKLLSVRACVCLDEKQYDTEEVLFSSLIGGTNGEVKNLLNSSTTWSEVSSKDTLITPLQCEMLWKQFVAQTEILINEAESEVKTYKHKMALRTVSTVGKVAGVVSGLVAAVTATIATGGATLGLVPAIAGVAILAEDEEELEE